MAEMSGCGSRSQRNEACTAHFFIATRSARKEQRVFNLLAGLGCVGGGIYLMEVTGSTSTAMSLISGLLILFGVFRLVMIVLDSGE